MVNTLVIARSEQKDIALLPALANRHGLITGATGTGKTVTLQILAEKFSAIGVPVFMADVKGDLSGLAAPGKLGDKLQVRLDRLAIADWQAAAFPTVFWDVFGEAGHPVRATVSDMGPLLIGRLLNLNETQAGVLQIVFRVADDRGLLLIDLKDLRAMVRHVGENAADFKNHYGNVSTASIGAIQRGLLEIEAQGGAAFFGEPMLDIADLMQTDNKGRGVINILAGEKLLHSPRVYSTFLLWLLAELFEQLPEAGDLDQPKIVFFFDEAHLLFGEAPPALLEKIEQVVRLIRSKGVGVYFVTQNPLDVPEKVLGQLGNRVQHALRAFTPRDQKAVKTAAETLRVNPAFSAESAITELGVGEALVSCLDEKGTPQIVERALIMPPASRIGPLDAAERRAVIEASLIYGHYEKTLDRESAFEKLQGQSADNANSSKPGAEPAGSSGGIGGLLGGLLGGGASAPARGRGRQPDSLGSVLAKSAIRTIGSSLGREIVRGVLGSILGGRR
jgi:hypothetical protein